VQALLSEGYAQDESLARLCPEYFTTKLAGYLASRPKQNMEKTL